jgi:hypothetical protein
MADAADEPTLKEFPEFPGEPMSKRCGATRAKDATTTADGAMDGWRDGATVTRDANEDDDDDDDDGRETDDALARAMTTTAQ